MESIKTFIDLDINPAKVVALYPESIAGRLAVPRTKWIELFGGKSRDDPSAPAEVGTPERQDSTSAGSILRAAVETLVPALPEAIPSLASHDDDTKSVHGQPGGNSGTAPRAREKSKGGLSTMNVSGTC